MQLTTWLIAKEEEAEAIASIVTTQEHSPEDWTFIEFPLITRELMALSAALRGSEDVAGESTMKEPLAFIENRLVVARVVDSFVQALANADPAKLPGIVRVWMEKMERDQYGPDQLQGLLSALADFARHAVNRGEPILTLVTF